MAKLTVDQIEVYQADSAGYCVECDSVTVLDGVEPDAEEIECPECGYETVMGIDQAILNLHIEVIDEPEDGGGVISWGSDDDGW